MTPNLRDHFDEAVRDDPGAELGSLATAAIAEGSRLRRRRNRLAATGAAAGLAAVIGVVIGLNVLTDRDEPAVTLAAAMMPVSAPSCLPEPVETGATDAAVFLADEVTAGQRSAIGATLRADPRVAALVFENREQAFEKFRVRWADSPDFLAAVDAEQLPESYRLRLVSGTDYTAVRTSYATMDGVRVIIGRKCSPDAPIGGTL